MVRALKKLTGIFLAGLLMSCAGEPPPFQPRLSQESERISATNLESRVKQPLPTTLESPFLTNGNELRPTPQPSTGPSLGLGPILRMPLQECVQRAVANNLDVKVAGYQPSIDETRVTEAEANWDPVFFSNLTYQRIDEVSGFGFQEGNGHQLQSSTGIRQNMPSGGQASLSYETGWTNPQRADATLGGSTKTFWGNDVLLQVTQPLLRDFGNEINRARITIARINQRVSLLEFRKQLEQSLADLEKTYWQLVAAERDVKIDEELLNQTIKTADVLFKRKGQDVTRVQLSQANASIESRRATLIGAKAHVRDLSDQLKQLMNDPDMPVSSPVLVLPANAPMEQAVHFDLTDQINTALENRFELGEAQLKIDSADVARKFAQNQLLPRLNAVGSISFGGVENDFGGATGQEFTSEELNYAIGLQLEIPIGNRENRAIYQRSLLQRQQAIDQYRDQIEKVALDVKEAARDVDTTWDQMVATRQARFAASDALLAIQQREEGGEALTPTFVQLKLDTQERLADAATNEVESVTNYNVAISHLEQTKGTLLRYDNVVMEEQLLPLGRRH
ncbi:MAG TPA: TolC family protein [Tepidisphaeraceae bacterium]|jgi:outer membrane protein TolC